MDYLCLRKFLPKNLALLCCAYNNIDSIISHGQIQLLRHMKITLKREYLSLGIKHIEIIKYLVSRGANIHAGYGSALGLATGNGYLDVVQYLVEMSAGIHIWGGYILYWAIMGGNLKVVKYLVEMGADIHASNIDTAVRWADSQRNFEIVEYMRSLN